MEISDLGFTGGLGLVVFVVRCAAGVWDLSATKGFSGAGLSATDGLAVGWVPGTGLGFVTDFGLGDVAFLSVWAWIFLRMTFGFAALSGPWSQPVKTKM